MITARRTDEIFLADKSAQEWSDRLIRCSSACPENIDDLLVAANNLAWKESGNVSFPKLGAMPLARHLSDTDRPAIGVLLDDRETRVADEIASLLAGRYAALAVEKECEVIILSHQDNAGFERFGFRVERIAGATDQERSECLEQLRRFWGIDIMI